MLVLEDLHWFDGASDAFLETTVENIPASRDLLLVNCLNIKCAGCSVRITSIWHCSR